MAPQAAPEEEDDPEQPAEAGRYTQERVRLRVREPVQGMDIQVEDMEVGYHRVGSLEVVAVLHRGEEEHRDCIPIVAGDAVRLYVPCPLAPLDRHLKRAAVFSADPR